MSKRRDSTKPLSDRARLLDDVVVADGARMSHPYLARRGTRRYETCLTSYPQPFCSCGAYRLLWPRPEYTGPPTPTTSPN